MLALQSLPQPEQTNLVHSAYGAFLPALLASSASVLSSSASFIPSLTAVRHAERSSACLSQSSMLILASAMSIWQTSSNLRHGRPVFLLPAASSPYRRSLGIQPGLILLTCPSHLRRRSLRMANMLGAPARIKTTLLDTLSCHLIPRIRRRHLRWKLFNFLSWDV